MQDSHSPSQAQARRAFGALLPFVLVVFLGYLPIGFAFGALPPYVHGVLGFGPAAVGWAVGLQSIATVLTRGVAGNIADGRGAKTAIVCGGLAALLSAGCGMLVAIVPASGAGSFALLAAGRLALGLAESLVMTGALSAAVSAVGVARAGLAMVWIGIALFAGIAAGAPVGAEVMATESFPCVAQLSGLAALALTVIGLSVKHVRRFGGERPAFHRVVGAIWPYGVSLGLGTVGYAALLSFLALAYQAKGWTGASLAVSAFGIAYIAARLVFGGLPDRLGGYRIVAGTLPVQALGLLLLWLADRPAVALTGAAIAGLGYALTFPALGVEAVRHVPAQSRGAAMGAYVAFIDIGLGATGPLGGVVVARLGYPAMFLASAILSLCALGGAFMARRRPARH